MLRYSARLYRNAYAGLSRPVWWLSVVMFINRSGTMVVPFLTVYLTSQLHFSIAQAGLVMGAFGAGAMAGAYGGGKLTDRVGFYQVQFWSLFLNGVLFFILREMHSIWQFAICIFVLSTVGESFRPANATAIAHYSDPANRTRSYSLNRLAINLGFSIGPAVGGILAAIDYKWLFWVDGFTCIAAAFMLRMMLSAGSRSMERKAVDHQERRRDSAFKDRNYLLFIVYMLGIAFCFLPMFSLVPVFYKEKIGLNETTIGLLLGSNGLLIALVEMVLVYKLEGKRTLGTYISIGALLIGLSYFVLTIAPIFLVAICGMFLITFGEMFLFPFVNTYWIGRSKEHNRGQYAALFTMAFSLGHVLAPTLGAQIIRQFGFDILWYLLCSICLLSAVGFYQLMKKN